MYLGNGTSESFDYDDRFQMKTQSLKKGSQVLQQYDYGYGKVDLATGAIDATKNNGQLGRIESFIGTQKQSQQRFDYDSIGRLSESREYLGATNTLTYKQKFDFDRFGNMNRKAANNGTAVQSNPLPMTAIEDSDISKSSNRFTTNTTYNEAGMVISDNKFRSMNFAYDANGRQVNATNATNSTNAQTVYDALGNRVATKVNDVWQFVIYDAFGKLVAEYGTQGEGNGGVSYVLQDWQGSVRASVNANGFIQARFDFTAFGEEISLGIGTRSIENGYSGDATTRQGYGLTEKDSSGLNHTWFRKNENRAGRWTSPDPYNGSMDTDNPQSFNRYGYVENEPTNFVDPSGLQLIAFFYTTCRYNPNWETESDKYICTQSVYFMNIGGSSGSGVETSGGGSFDPPPPSVENNDDDDYAKCRADVYAAHVDRTLKLSIDLFKSVSSNYTYSNVIAFSAAVGGILGKSLGTAAGGLSVLLVNFDLTLSPRAFATFLKKGLKSAAKLVKAFATCAKFYPDAANRVGPYDN